MPGTCKVYSDAMKGEANVIYILAGSFRFLLYEQLIELVEPNTAAPEGLHSAAALRAETLTSRSTVFYDA